jgi:kynureninase
VYVDGNSLGRPPLAAAEAVAAVAEDWAERLVGGWEDWIGLPVDLGNRIGAALLGARPGEVVVCDSVTVNLFKLAGAALAARPDGVVLCDPEEFPTDRYVLAGLGREVVDCAPTAEASRRPPRAGRSRSRSSPSWTIARGPAPTCAA